MCNNCLRYFNCKWAFFSAHKMIVYSNHPYIYQNNIIVCQKYSPDSGKGSEIGQKLIEDNK